MTERIMLQPGGAGQMLGCENCMSDGSVLSHSERFSRFECFRVHTKRKTPCTSICVPSYKGFWLDGRVVPVRAGQQCSHHRLLGTASSCGPQAFISLTLAMALLMLARSLMSNHTRSSLPTI